MKASGDSTEGGGLLSLVLVYVKENALLHVKRSTFFFQVFVFFLKREREREFFEEIFFFFCPNSFVVLSLGNENEQF